MNLTRFPHLCLLCLVLCLTSSPLTAAPGIELQPFKAKFRVTRNNINLGTMHVRLTLDESGNYSYSGNTKPGAMLSWLISDKVKEISRGRYKNGHIEPLSYEYKQSNGEILKKHILLDFDWPDKLVWTESEGTRWSQPITAGAQDKFSQQLALRLDLSNGKKSVSYAVADGGRIKNYNYRVAGSESIKVPYGRLKCLKVRRSKDSKAPDFTIWIAPELDYLPIRIERKRSSGKYRMELLEFQKG